MLHCSCSEKRKVPSASESSVSRPLRLIYKIKYNDNLFGNLKDVLQRITGDSVVDKIDGGTRLLRKSSASTMYNKYLKGEASPSDIYQQIRTMAHSPDTHLKNYVFSLKPNA